MPAKNNARRAPHTSSLVPASLLYRKERHRGHQPVFLRFQRAEFRDFLGVGQPLRIGPHRGAAHLAVGGILVSPDVDVLVDVAGLGGEEGERLAEVAGLRTLAHFLVERDVLLDGAGPAGVGTYVEQHGFPLCDFLAAGCRPA